MNITFDISFIILNTISILLINEIQNLLLFNDISIQFFLMEQLKIVIFSQNFFIIFNIISKITVLNKIANNSFFNKISIYNINKIHISLI